MGGTIGAPCHEDRIKGFEDCMAQYPDIEVVEIQYDNDSVEQSSYLYRRLPAEISGSERYFL
ncbi:MAG: hypothetical protein ACLTX6_10920 [Lachnospiraceae bacterium]